MVILLLIKINLSADSNNNYNNQETLTLPNSSISSMLHRSSDCNLSKIDDDKLQCSDACFTTINEALTNSFDGDTINVCSGIYNEVININKDNLTITSQTNDASSVIIENSSNNNLLTIDAANTITLKYLTFKQNSSNKNAIVINSYSNNISFDELNITSNGSCIQTDNNDNGNIKIKNSQINCNKKGINIKKDIANFKIINSNIQAQTQALRLNTINGSIFIDETNISSSTSYGIQFGGDIDGLVELKNTIIKSSTIGINFKNSANSGIKISNCDINSTSNIGVKFGGNVWGIKTYIENSKFSGYDEGLLFIGKDIKPTITNSTISSETKNALNVLNFNSDSVDMNNSCSFSNTDGMYAFRLRRNNTNSNINNNCFYANNPIDLAFSRVEGNNFIGNYWDGHTGDYTFNKISDTQPLPSCLLPCSKTYKESQSINYKFDAFDTYRNLNDRNISTKIVLQDFNLTISETSSTDFNGTLCATIDKSTWSKVLFENSHESIATFNHPKAIKNAKIYLEWVENQDSLCPLNIDDNNNTYSTDSFALRPKNFSISSIDEQNAGETFVLSILASSAKDYNESIGSSFFIDANIIKQGCQNGVLYIPNQAFIDGNLTFDTNYSDIGDLNITIYENNISSFAQIDNDDTPDNQRLIPQTSKIISFLPYELVITNYSYKNTNNLDWLYMDDRLEQNTTISFTVQAQNYSHESLSNFDKNCYAKEVNVSLNFAPDVNLSQLTKINTTKVLNEQNFTNGKSTIQTYIYNIKRDMKNPLNPIDINLSDINTTNQNMINIGINLETNGTKYYFGRIHSPDYIIDKITNINTAYEVYCDSCKEKNSTWKQSLDSYNWYRFLDTNASFHILTKTETIIINTPSYLRYNIFGEDINNSFFVEFIGTVSSTNWDDAGKHVDLNVSLKSNNRIEW